MRSITDRLSNHPPIKVIDYTSHTLSSSFLFSQLISGDKNLLLWFLRI